MRWLFFIWRTLHYGRLIKSLVSDRGLKKHVYGLEAHLLYKRHRIC